MSLKISIKEALKILELNYNIKGVIQELDGEVDFNFKIESKCGKNYLANRFIFFFEIFDIF